MKRITLTNIISALNDNQVRYLIAGGLAVVFHGYLRFTSDLDLILDLDENNLKKAIAVFEELGYIPRVPVKFSDLAKTNVRQKWIKEKEMTVFSIFNPDSIETPIDIFVQIPFDFETEHSKAPKDEIAPGIKANFISYEQLINLKKISNRDIDKIDVENLERIHKS